MSDGMFYVQLHRNSSPKFSNPMSAPGAEDSDGAGPHAPLVAEPAGGRVWQACLVCRRKKIKCDGKEPCYNCSSRDQTCEFPGTKDNASASRYYSTSVEARCQKMDSLCERLETLTSQLSRSLESMHRSPRASSTGSQSEDLMIAAQLLDSRPEIQESTNDELKESSGSGNSDTDSDELQDGNAEEREGEHVGHAGALVRDSYGHTRFIGGATHSILIEAAKSLLPAGTTTTPSSTGTSQSTLSAEDIEFPLFVRGKVWPEMPFIPKPEELQRPPKYVADLLISLYFDKLHDTFPVLFRTHFERRYQKLREAGRDHSSTKHRHFLMVFFAVCACSSNLLPPSSESDLPGIDYYQKALLILNASTGEASLERVQCLALLSMCSAGWNTLSQSWILAGQAVRAAQDMGLHLSRRSILSLAPEPNESRHSEFLRVRVSRRVWWCVYTLDRITSICLGRPMAVQDNDCDCELPLDEKDEDLQRQHAESNPHRLPKAGNTSDIPSLMSGFVAFARLSQLAGKIQHLNSPLKLRKLASADSDKTQRFLSQVDNYDQALRNWLRSLPPHIQFSANSMAKSSGGDPALVMCVITFVLHAGSLLNLYRCFLNYPKQAALEQEVDTSGAISQCVSAAQMCIHAAEIIRDLVPTSHYLALSIHYMTLSGIVLLRVASTDRNIEVFDDVGKCVKFLKDMQDRWSGAKRSRIIIEQLLHHHQRSKHAPEGNSGQNQPIASSVQARSINKRTLDDFENTKSPGAGEDIAWDRIPGLDLFPLDPVDPILFSSRD